MMRYWFSSILLGGVCIASGCSGPRPEIGTATVLPPRVSGGPYQVALDLKNLGAGEGQVEVDVWLHEESRARTYFSDRKVNLRSHENLQIIVEVVAPTGNYTAEVKANYPPD